MATTLPPALPLSQVLNENAALQRLSQRLRESNRRFEVVARALPLALRQQLRAGPVDEDGWTLLAPNAAVAAKLRHLLPRLEQLLRDEGLGDKRIRVHLRP
jgi:cytochrome c-type biogenesis protein CcmH/NrfG